MASIVTCNGVKGQLAPSSGQPNSTLAFAFAPADGQAPTRIDAALVRQLQVSKKNPAAVRLVLSGSEAMPLTVEFDAVGARQEFVDAITNFQRVKKEEEDEEAGKKKLLLAAAAAAAAGGASAAPAHRPYSFHANVSELQRAQECRQLHALLAPALGLNDTTDLAAMLEPHDADAKRTLASAHQQGRGVRSVFDALQELVTGGGGGGDSRIVTEQLMSDIFRQVPELAVVYRMRVTSRAQEAEFWEAVVQRTRFFSTTFLETEITRARAAIINSSGGKKGAKKGAPTEDATAHVEVREAPNAAGSFSRKGGGKDPVAELAARWNDRSAAVVDGAAAAAVSTEGVDGNNGAASDGRSATILAHTALFDDATDDVVAVSRGIAGASAKAARASAGDLTDVNQLVRHFVPAQRPAQEHNGDRAASSSVVTGWLPSSAHRLSLTFDATAIADRTCKVAPSHHFGRQRLQHTEHSSAAAKSGEGEALALVRAFWRAASSGTPVGLAKSEELAERLLQHVAAADVAAASHEWSRATLRMIDRIRERSGDRLPTKRKKSTA